jgi:aldose 1-epimerase
MNLKRIVVIYIFVICGLISSCGNQESEMVKKVTVNENGNKSFYGVIGSDSVYRYTLKNSRGLKAVITNYGGIILELWTPDKTGTTGDVVLGFDSLSGYLQKGNPYLGALVGRYANRIGQAMFSLDGKIYKLAANNGPNALHGGLKGFDKKVWTVDQVNDSSLAISLTSPDGEEGYPGTLNVKVVYTVTNSNSLCIDYTALTDKKTPVNLTNHSYFNLSAGRDSGILNEELTLNASSYTPVNETLIPTGEIAKVAGTPMDFIKSKTIAKDIAKVKGGYDHNFIINRKDSLPALAATVYEPISGRQMQVWTTQPGIQFYTSNFMDGTLTNKDGKKMQAHAALCLETQHFPDSPNQPSFPNVILEPGQTYHETTIYKFSTR